LTRDASERLERFYADLRRCSQRCDGRPYVEHRAEGAHDCAEKKCRQHECRPYSASSIRQVHGIISGTLSAAVRWGWIPYNPAPAARLPAKRRVQPHPPTAAQMARIIEAANESSAEWGTYLWLSAVTGARRGEIVALQWEDIDLDPGVIVLDENYVRGPDGMILKDTKTHQGRRVSMAPDTVRLLRQHKAEATRRLELLGLELTGKTWLFSAKPDLSAPRDPSSLTRRYSRLVAKLGIETQLKELRHYSATELLTAGVDVRTVAGRLGHGDGATTLWHYAAWVNAADQAAASTIGRTMPKLNSVSE
jgi:integrase